MYQPNKVVENLLGHIGFEPAYMAEVPEIDDDLTSSRSGMFVNRLHPLLTYENLLTAAELFSQQTVRAYDNARAYPAGAIVSKGGKIWQALQTTTGNDPEAVSSLHWRETNLFSAYLRTKYAASTQKLISTIFTEKKLAEGSKSLLAASPLYAGQGRIKDRILKTGSFRGIRITLRHPNTVVALRHIGLQLDTAQNAVDIYLYHSSQSNYLHKFTLVHTQSVSFQWHQIEEYLLEYGNQSQFTGGHFYIGYYEVDLTGSAIEKEQGFDGKIHCGSCSDAVTNSQLYSGWSKVVRLASFHVNEEALDLEDRTLGAEEDAIYDGGFTYGINLNIGAWCDLTYILSSNAAVLTEALAQQLKVDFLTELLYTTRDNQKSEQLHRLAGLALDDNKEGGQERKRLADLRKEVEFDLSGLGSVCAPCIKTSYKLGTVYGKR